MYPHFLREQARDCILYKIENSYFLRCRSFLANIDLTRNVYAFGAYTFFTYMNTSKKSIRDGKDVIRISCIHIQCEHANFFAVATFFAPI